MRMPNLGLSGGHRQPTRLRLDPCQGSRYSMANKNKVTISFLDSVFIREGDLKEEFSMKHLYRAGSNPDQPTLLLLHGTGGNEEDLLPLAKMISPEAGVLSVRGNVLENGMPRFFRRLAEGVFDEEDLVFRTGELVRFLDEASREYGFEAEAAGGCRLFQRGQYRCQSVVSLSRCLGRGDPASSDGSPERDGPARSDRDRGLDRSRAQRPHLCSGRDGGVGQIAGASRCRNGDFLAPWGSSAAKGGSTTSRRLVWKKILARQKPWLIRVFPFA